MSKFEKIFVLFTIIFIAIALGLTSINNKINKKNEKKNDTNVKEVYKDANDKTYFTVVLKETVKHLSSNTNFRELQYNDGYTYMTLEYEYEQCVSNCKREFDLQALELYEEIASMKDRIKNTDITAVDIQGYTTFIDDYGNEKSLLGVRYEMSVEDLLKINFDNFTNIEKYNTMYHTGL